MCGIRDVTQRGTARPHGIGGLTSIAACGSSCTWVCGSFSSAGGVLAPLTLQREMDEVRWSAICHSRSDAPHTIALRVPGPYKLVDYHPPQEGLGTQWCYRTFHNYGGLSVITPHAPARRLTAPTGDCAR